MNGFFYPKKICLLYEEKSKRYYIAILSLLSDLYKREYTESEWNNLKQEIYKDCELNLDDYKYEKTINNKVMEIYPIAIVCRVMEYVKTERADLLKMLMCEMLEKNLNSIIKQCIEHEEKEDGE